MHAQWRWYVAVGVVWLLSSGAPAIAGDAAVGMKKAHQCQSCHGLDGIAKIPEAPNLAGQNEQYLVKALGDFKSGDRKNDIMSLIAPNLSDTDIADLAAYYSSLAPGAAPK
jgi:cytochrome c553